MFNEETMKALHGWLDTDTWYKSHAFDDERFYNFVYAAWKEKRGLWDEMGVRDLLLREARRLHPGFDEEELKRVIERRRKEAAVILEFLAYMDSRGLRP